MVPACSLLSFQVPPPWPGLTWLDDQTSKTELDREFNSFDEAQIEIELLMKDLTRAAFRARYMCNNARQPNAELQRKLASTRRHLKAWSLAFERLVQDRGSPSQEAAKSELSAIASLRVNECIARATVETIVTTDQMCFDEYLADFQEVVEHSEEFLKLTAPNDDSSPRSTFSFPMGILNSLYIVCTRCRDPFTRRRALHLLKSCNRREGIFDSLLVARAAEEFIKMEERSAEHHWKALIFNDCQSFSGGTDESNGSDTKIQLQSMEDIPECCRLDRIDTVFSEEKSADMTFVGTTGEWQNQVVNWDR